MVAGRKRCDAWRCKGSISNAHLPLFWGTQLHWTMKSVLKCSVQSANHGHPRTSHCSTSVNFVAKSVFKPHQLQKDNASLPCPRAPAGFCIGGTNFSVGCQNKKFQNVDWTGLLDWCSLWYILRASTAAWLCPPLEWQAEGGSEIVQCFGWRRGHQNGVSPTTWRHSASQQFHSAASAIRLCGKLLKIPCNRRPLLAIKRVAEGYHCNSSKSTLIHKCTVFTSYVHMVL